MGYMPYATSVAPDQPVRSGSLVSRYAVRCKVMHDFVVSLADRNQRHKKKGRDSSRQSGEKTKPTSRRFDEEFVKHNIEYIGHLNNMPNTTKKNVSLITGFAVRYLYNTRLERC
ncbi:hypothetical protein DPMN_036386 [Dreissena polymorpha]|uniref:Uncharacterized protein n=1 Tax=Dreissena polymorpha TaxID=45954 RepID=A0A9D4MCF8_DREPO|nr:hypothetical protein DPMN_036386 [Dreissena polymorpha]